MHSGGKFAVQVFVDAKSWPDSKKNWTGDEASTEPDGFVIDSQEVAEAISLEIVLLVS